MAKPRIFVSSTYIDLKHARHHLEGFIDSLGYEAVLFESGDIPFNHSIPIDESCYAEINNCHMLVLIIGGKYGSPASEQVLNYNDEAISFYNSITRKEYEVARAKGIPIFIFVEQGVHTEYQTFKKNRNNTSINYAHVDNINIFKLLDDIVSQRFNNYVKSFDNFDNISMWLKDQWSGMFADFLTKNHKNVNLQGLQDQIIELKQISNSLQIYNEQMLMALKPKESEAIIKNEKNKIEINTINRFVTTPLIDFLLNDIFDDSRALDVNEIFEYFLMSKNLTEFLRSLNIDEMDIQRLASSYDVQEDYKLMRINFLNEPYSSR